MSDPINMWPLFKRTETEIRQDFDARANAGLNPGDPDWVDTSPPSLYWEATQPMVIFYARQVDRMNEIAAAGILASSWGPYLDLHAESYAEARKVAVQATGAVTFTAVGNTDPVLIGTGTRATIVQTDPDHDPPIFETTQSGTIAPGGGSVTLNVRAVDAGQSGNVASDEVTQLISSVPGVTSLTNTDKISGGAEVESDAALKKRLENKFAGQGGGNQADYIQWSLEYPGIGAVTVIPVWDGPGTVQLIILDENLEPASAALVTAFQLYMDPSSAGLGEGRAPIDHTVTVSTPTSVAVSLAATISFKPGFSLDGTSGTIAMRDALEAAVQEYFDSLLPGDDVIINHARAALFLEGVLDVTAITLNAGTSNISITTSPAQVAELNSVALS